MADATNIQIISRKEARTVGQKWYFSGTPCKYGHIDKRKVTNGHCFQCNREANSEWKADNQEAVSAYNSQYYANNIEKEKTRISGYYKATQPDRIAKHAFYRAKRMGLSGDFTGEDILRLFDKQNGLCATCGVNVEDGYHIDHKTPLGRGGSNFITNIQILCASCNFNKGRLTNEEWLKRRTANKNG